MYLCRQKPLNFLQKSEDFRGLTSSAQHSLLVKNAPKISRLLDITRTSLNNGESEWQFLLSKANHRHFNGKHPSAEFVIWNEIGTVLPWPAPMTKTITMMTMSSSRPLLTNRTVFMLMVLIMIFDDPRDPNVTAIKEQYWTMLRRNLRARKLCSSSNLEFCLADLRMCSELDIPLLVETWALAYQNIGI